MSDAIWGAAITAAAGLLGGVFQNKAQKDSLKDQRAYDREKEIRQLELEKFRIMMGNKGGGGGRDKMLDLLEMALGAEGNAAALKSKTYERMGNQAQQAYLSNRG